MPLHQHFGTPNFLPYKAAGVRSRVKSFSMRATLNLAVFIVANFMYDDVFKTVGYMYNVEIVPSFFKIIFAASLCLFLTSISNFKDDYIRQTFDICILGIFLPIAVMYCQISTSPMYLLPPFISIIMITLSFRIFQGTRLIKSMSSRDWGSVSFSDLKKLVFYAFIPFMFVAIMFNFERLSFDIFDIYLRVYEIRAETSADGILGYTLGWFILFFPPLFLSRFGRPLKLMAPLLALVGAFVVFNIFGLKSIFLNFFLVAFFALLNGRRGFKYLPQIFFLLLFLLTYLLGPALHPLLDRFFYLVGLNSIYYFDFFSVNPLRFFEGTTLGFGISNYGIVSGYLIDNAYYQGLGTNQSAGYLPSIFSDIGMIGVILSSFIIGFIISVVNTMRIGSDNYAYLVLVAFAFALMNHPLPMLFLSNGLVFVLIFAAIVKRKAL
jgi:hypothetical protein